MGSSAGAAQCEQSRASSRRWGRSDSLGFDSRSHREGGLGGGWEEEGEEEEEEGGVEGGGSCGGGRRAPGQVSFFCALMARFKSVVIFLNLLIW